MQDYFAALFCGGALKQQLIGKIPKKKTKIIVDRQFWLCYIETMSNPKHANDKLPADTFLKHQFNLFEVWVLDRANGVFVFSGFTRKISQSAVKCAMKLSRNKQTKSEVK